MTTIVFGLSVDDEGTPFLLLGVPKDAWEYMKDGKTFTFDLTKANLNLKLMIFGADDRASAARVIEDHNKSVGVETMDFRDRDFSIKLQKLN